MKIKPLEFREIGKHTYLFCGQFPIGVLKSIDSPDRMYVVSGTFGTLIEFTTTMMSSPETQAHLLSDIERQLLIIVSAVIEEEAE